MTRAFSRVGTGVCIGLLLAGIGLSGARAASSPAVSVTVDRTRVSTSLGRTFSFRTRITNDSTRAAPSLVAHLNVLSLLPGTYVDPEDWSSHRTRYLGTLHSGASRTIDWTVKAVNSGSIGVYVAVLPQSGAPVPPVTGATVHAEIATHTTLNPAGVLPLALGVPSLLVALALGVRLTRRRR
jgi:hypothetical protein